MPDRPPEARASPVAYEVTVRVAPDVAEAYAAWLEAHIGEMLALGGFTSATWYVVDTGASQAARPNAGPDADDAGSTVVEFCVRYGLQSRAALEHYLAEHAPRLREDGLRRFGTSFTATRRVMALRGAW